jgi:A/G-specific adenine glycosylase
VTALNIRRFQKNLLAWYGTHHRPLPWRKTRSPYRIWISEIMLQQTRVAAVLEKYREFLKRFPSVKALAAARSSDVLAAWSGLGYYRRARSAHQTAKLVVSEHAGRFPCDREQLRSLPGIGEYTSAAIASIAFGSPHAVVDGNVRRVVGRVFGKQFSSRAYALHAQELLARAHPGDFNQAMMELGALVCTPEPKCDRCPVFRECATRGKHQVKSTATRIKRREVRFALALRNDRVFLVQRPRSASLMPGMWELPADQRRASKNALKFRHSITDTNFLVSVTQRTLPPSSAKGRWVPREHLEKIPLTGLARKILRHTGLL